MCLSYLSVTTIEDTNMTDSTSLNEPLSKAGSKRASMSTIESSVTRLLVSTKHLLESLTQWARQEADDKFVSDAYVKLGNDFRAAARAFTIAGVDISDLGDVPKALRIVLESALSESPTQENLDRFLPNIRNIIVNLLLNLKSKQIKAKELSAEKTLKKLNNPSSTTVSSDTKPSGKNNLDRSSVLSKKTRILSEQQIKSRSDEYEANSDRRSLQINSASNDALAQLQKGNVILRRASKRFSAYQFAKLTNFSNNQLPRITGENSNVAPPDTSADFEDDRKEQSTGDFLPSSNSQTSIQFYLRVNDRTKKVQSQLPITLASLRLLFVEKFAYSPGSSTFPEIYVSDPQHNMSFELEEQHLESEIKDGTLLFLKEADPQVTSLNELESKIQNLNNRFDEVAFKISSDVREALASVAVEQIPPQSEQADSSDPSSKHSKISSAINEISVELKAMRQILNSKSVHMSTTFAQLTKELACLKTACFEDSSTSSNRGYMEQSYAKLSEDSDLLLTKVDDLQDMMEALRKDVAQRGVRLGPKQLKSTHKEIADAKILLENLSVFIAEGKPTWKKIWEAELDKVCEEQQFFNLQDDLSHDLQEDIQKIEETFNLIEKCSLEQSKQQQSKRSIFPPRLPEPGETVQGIREAVLSEVAAMVPDHEGRLDAIARAEKLRAKEMQNWGITQFQEELGDFVEDKRLKKSGGIEELERMRQLKDIENFKSSFGIV